MVDIRMQSNTVVYSSTERFARLVERHSEKCENHRCGNGREVIITDQVLVCCTETNIVIEKDVQITEKSDRFVDQCRVVQIQEKANLNDRKAVWKNDISMDLVLTKGTPMSHRSHNPDTCSAWAVHRSALKWFDCSKRWR